jgi:DNA-binding Xre family transcriptional regulator
MILIQSRQHIARRTNVRGGEVMVRVRLKANGLSQILARKNMSQNNLAHRLQVSSVRQRILDWAGEADFDDLFEPLEENCDSPTN